MATKAELIRELVGTVCRCGDPKKARQTFCRICYYRLPPQTRRALYAPFGEGYEEAYEQAELLLAAGVDKADWWPAPDQRAAGGEGGA